MKSAFSREWDATFGQMMLTLRTALNLTQAELAGQLGVSRRAIGGWEAGNSAPKAEHLKHFIELAVRKQVFPAGQEAEEIRVLWKKAHQKVLLDEEWLQALLAPMSQREALTVPSSGGEVSVDEPALASAPPATARPAGGPRVDWGDALIIPSFYGREQDMEVLSTWIVQERCRVVSVLGMGGIGKSALAVRTMSLLAEPFEVVIFRSLRDAPSCEALLDDCLQVLSPQSGPIPVSLEQRMSFLLDHLSRRRTLLILDNLESLLDEEELTGRFRPGFEGYELLLCRMAQTAHQSCLLLTSREKAAVLRPLESRSSLIRSLRLSGLDVSAGERLLAEKDLKGTDEDKAYLIERYAGNPLALRIVSNIIVDLFGGHLEQFLAGGTVVFSTMTALLDEQFVRLSRLEQSLLRWLAILREPVTLEELKAVMVERQPHGVLEAVDSLYRRSLIERGQCPGSFTLQSVVLEYITSVLIATVTEEIQQGQLDVLIQHGLELAQSREDIRQAQQCLLLMPTLTHLKATYQIRPKTEVQLIALLEQLRELAGHAQGYGPANLIALLRLLRGHLRGADLSRLMLRGAYLQGVEMQDALLVDAQMRDTVFTEAFDVTWAAAISPDGQYWAVGGRRGEVRVWRERGQVLHLAWLAHSDTTYTLAFSPDGRTLATGSWDGTVKLWDVQSGALYWTGRNTNSINCVTFAPDGRLLASSGGDAAIQLWEVMTGVNVQTMPQSGPVFSMAWSPDGHVLACGNFDGSIRLWQMQGNQLVTCIATLTGHTNWVFTLAFSPDGSALASASWDKTVKLWEVSSGQERQTLTGHTGLLHTVAWSPDGRTVASAGFDKTIWLWDVEQGSYRTALHGHTAMVYALAFTPDSCCLLSGGEDGTLRVWDVESGQCVRILQGYAVSSYDICWSPDGSQLASADSDALVTLWDITSEDRPRELYGHRWTVLGVVWSSDGQFLASSGRDNAIRLWDPVMETCLHVLRDSDAVDTIFYGLALSPDGRLLASGSFFRGVMVWDVKTSTRLWVGRTHPARIRSVAWSSDGRQLASGGDDGCVCVWDVVDGTLLKRLEAHCGGAVCIAWHPDGMWLASGCGSRESGELFVWDAQRGERVRTFAGLTHLVSAVTWSPHGDLLICGDSDGKLFWWNVSSQECVRQQVAHQGMVLSLKVSPDGNRLASCGDDGTIRIWNVQSGELLRMLRRDRPYERLDITGIRGLNEAQKATLRLLGAVEAH